jgi:hypothetical protein
MNITLLPKNILAALTLLCVLLGPLLQISNAAMNRGIYFDDEIIVDGQTLNLHGIGLLKWKHIVNVYLVALYKPKAVPIKDILKRRFLSRIY